MIFRNLLAVLFLFTMAASVPAALINEVPANAQDELAQGQVVVKSKNVSGAPWPKLSLYQVVNAPPAVVWNLFTDLSAAPTYTPNLVSASVIATNPDGSKNVQFTTKVPVLGSISYTVRNTYTQNPPNYEVDWTLIKSPLAKSSDGSLRIAPYGKNQTLMCYTNLCVPITNLVAGLKNQALNEAKTTVRAITAEAEKRAGN